MSTTNPSPKTERPPSQLGQWCSRNDSGDPEPFPWHNARASTRKWMLAVAVHRADGPKPVREIVEDAHENLINDGSDFDTNRKLAERFFRRHSGFFSVEERDGHFTNWVSATPELMVRMEEIRSLDRGVDKGERQEGEGVDRVLAKLGWVDEESIKANTVYAKERVREFFERTNRVTSEGQKRYVAAEMGCDLDTRNELMALTHNDGKGWSTESLDTRFTSIERAKKSYGNFMSTLESAALDHGHTRATKIEVTTDPKMFDSIQDQYSSLVKDDYSSKKKALYWIQNRASLDSTPLNCYKLEISDSGMVHIHMVVFGVTPGMLPSESEFSDFMSTRQGSEVRFRECKWFGRKNRWMMMFDNGNRVPLRDYLAKDGLREMMDVAAGDADPRDIEQDGRKWWKLAFYFAFGAKMWASSPGLGGHNPIPDDSLPSMVGAVDSIEAIPKFIKSKLSQGDVVGLDRPPGEAEEVVGPPPNHLV